MCALVDNVWKCCSEVTTDKDKTARAFLDIINEYIPQL